MKTAWLIGAGFSYELGLPLVSELTSELRSLLTLETLRQENASAKPNHRHPLALLDEFAPVVQRPDLNYEQIIGWLQTQSLRRHRERAELLKLAGAVQDVVGRLLLGHHLSKARLFQDVLPWFRGLENHLPEDGPLWIFSLNHDVCVEMLGAELGVEVNCGYGEPSAKLLTSTGEERVLDCLKREQLAAGVVNFGPPVPRRVNLVKLHGSLDVFGYDDLTSYLRVRPASPSAAGWLAAIESAEKDLHALHDGQRYKTINEICTRDALGVIQFLRRTPVAGALKFDRKMTYNAPVEFIELFEQKLDDFDTLVVIGYGWGDAHINGPVEAWLARRPEARLIVVNPGGLPPAMDALSDRCEPRKVAAAEYVSMHRWSTFSKLDHLKRQLRSKFRTDPQCMTRFASGMRDLQGEMVALIPELVRLGSDGLSRQELKARAPSLETMLESVLARMDARP
jgi:hypothetical protein